MFKKSCLLKKTYVIIFIIVIMILSSTIVVFAHQNQGEHDDDLQDVLFGEGYVLTGESKQKFQAIADAASLCIDQFSTNETIHSKEDLFSSLNKRIGFSFSFSDIELQKGSDGKNITAKTHRWYTHRGWDFPEYSLKEKWEKRKTILTATVNKELFGKSPGFFAKLPWAEGLIYSEKSCNKQSEAFCELVYYVHILGDYEEARAPSQEFIQQLAPLYRPNDNSAPGIIPDIINLLPDLFRDQWRSRENLIQDLEDIKGKAEKYRHDNIQTQEEFDKYRQCSLELMNLLKERIPDMLRREEFFRTSFY